MAQDVVAVDLQRSNLATFPEMDIRTSDKLGSESSSDDRDRCGLGGGVSRRRNVINLLKEVKYTDYLTHKFRCTAHGLYNRHLCKIAPGTLLDRSHAVDLCRGPD